MNNQVPLKIAILTSEVATATLLTQILAKDGHKDIKVFADGLGALKALRDQPFNFVICDMSIRFISGWTLIREVKASDKIPNVPCMLLGKAAAPGSEEELKQYGIVKYLQAPFRESEVTFLISSTLMVAATSGTIENKYSKAKEALLANKPKEAVEKYQELHGLTKKNLRSSLGLAEAYLQDSQTDKANEVMLEAVQNSKEVSPTSMMMQSNILLKKKTAAQAYTITTKLLDEVMPATPFYFSKSLKVYTDYKEFTYAELICQKGIERKFKLPEFKLTMARCNYEQGAFAHALAAIKSAQDEYGPSTDLCNLRGVCLKKTGDYAGAILAYEEALRLSPMDAKIYFNMASCAISSKRYLQAEKYLESCLQINASFPKVREKLAEIRALKNPVK